MVDPELVAEKVGVCPATALLKVSLRVIVTVEFATPFATTGLVPVIVELAAIAPVALKVTVFPVTATGEVSCKVLTSAVVEAKVHTDRPLAFEEEHEP